MSVDSGNSGVVSDSWKRIRHWLSEHAPRILGNLNPSASRAGIKNAERLFGVVMPDDWYQVYANHDGMNDDGNLGSLFFGMRFLTLKRAIEEHSLSNTGNAELLPVRAADAGIRREHMYNPKWIAIVHDGGDTLLRVDMDPGPGGIVGQVIFTDHSDDTVILVARSVGELLTGFVNDLENGKYFLDEAALREGDQFLNCVEEIDLVNWHKSPRWKHLAR